MFRVASSVCRIGLVLGGSFLMFAGLGSSAFAIDIAVPEIDPGFISSAMTLLVGSALVIMGRRVKQ